jgi:Ca2+-binding EF-hand superfamily protein
MRTLPTLLIAAAAAFTLCGVAEAQGRRGGRGPGGGPSAGPGGGGSGGPSAGPGKKGKRHGKRPGKKKRPGGGQIFQRLDADGDGQISAAEAAAAKDPAKIMAADANGDGFVTKDELRTHHQAQVFARLDKDGDGTLSGGELRRARRLKNADADGDGTVTKAEFDAFVAQQAAKRQTTQQLHQAFQAADANADRELDASEWPANANASFADVDANGDGAVTPREIGAYLQANNGSSPL